jgi:hypothetical protein
MGSGLEPTGAWQIIYTVKHALYIVGAIFELSGIMLSVSPDLVPGATVLCMAQSALAPT